MLVCAPKVIFVGEVLVNPRLAFIVGYNWPLPTTTEYVRVFVATSINCLMYGELGPPPRMP